MTLLHENSNLLILFYKELSRTKTSFIRKKFNINVSLDSIHICIQFGKFILTAALIYVFYLNLYSLSKPVYTFIIALFYTIQCFSILFTSSSKIKTNFKYDFLRLSSTDDNKFFAKILLYNYTIETFLLIPFLFPLIVSAIIFLKSSLLPFFLFIHISSFFTYLVRHNSAKNKLIKILLTIISRLCVALFGYSIMWLIVKIMLISREGIIKNGFTTDYVLWVDNKLNYFFISKIKYLKDNLHLIFDYSNSYIFLLISAFILILSFILINKIKSSNDKLTYSFPEWYKDFLSRRIYRFKIDSPYLYKDICLFFNLGRKLEVNYLSIFLTNELFLVIGGNLALLGHINNIYILLFLLFIELYITAIGALRTITFYFSDIFKFKNDCDCYNLLYVNNAVDTKKILHSKYVLLKTVGNIPCLITCSALIINYAFYLKFNTLFLAIDILFVILLYNNFVKFILSTDYEFFCIVLKNGIVIKNLSLDDYTGYNLISTASKSLNKFIFYILTLISLILAFFILITGFQWFYYYSGFVSVFMINLIISSHYSVRETAA